MPASTDSIIVVVWLPVLVHLSARGPVTSVHLQGVELRQVWLPLHIQMALVAALQSVACLGRHGAHTDDRGKKAMDYVNIGLGVLQSAPGVFGCVSTYCQCTCTQMPTNRVALFTLDVTL